jgi:hypothetical protein
MSFDVIRPLQNHNQSLEQEQDVRGGQEEGEKTQRPHVRLVNA